MAVLDLWSNHDVWTGPGRKGSTYFTNPWSTEHSPACNVWMQLTTGEWEAYYPSANYFGFLEIEYVDKNGVQQHTLRVIQAIL